MQKSPLVLSKEPVLRDQYYQKELLFFSKTRSAFKGFRTATCGTLMCSDTVYKCYKTLRGLQENILIALENDLERENFPYRVAPSVFAGRCFLTENENTLTEISSVDWDANGIMK